MWNCACLEVTNFKMQQLPPVQHSAFVIWVNFYMCAIVCYTWTQKLWTFLWFLKSRSIYGDFFFPFNLGFGSYMPTFVWFLGIGLKPKMDMPWLRITSFFLYLHTELIVLALRLSFMVAIWDFYCFPINANPLWSLEDYLSLFACF